MIALNHILALVISGLAIHGLMLIVLLMATRSVNRLAIAYSLILLVLSLVLAEYAMTMSEISQYFPHGIAVKIPLLYLLGPLYYLFMRYKSGGAFLKADLLHGLPGLIVILLLMPYYVLSGSAKYTVAASDSGQYIRLAYLMVNLIQMMIYAYLGHTRFSDVSSSLKQEVRYLKSGFSLLVGLYTLAILLSLPVFDVASDIRFLFVLGLGLLVNVMGYQLLMNGTLLKVKNNELSLEIEELAKRIELYFGSKRPFLKKGISIRDIALELDTNTAYISQAINRVYKSSFTDYINQHRIEEAKQRLKANHSEKIYAVGLETGFKSKSSFVRVFKKHTGLTPSQFRNN